MLRFFSPYQARLKILFLVFAVSFVISKVQAQSFDKEFGARSKGMGNANVANLDEWAIFNNVAGISAIEKGSVAFGYDRFFNVDGFDKVALAAVQPIKFGSLGLAAHRFGDEIYSEHLVSGAFANKIGFVRLGVRVNYFQMRVEEFGTSSAVLIDFGGIVELNPELSFGAYISNLTASKLNDESNSRLPVMMKLGFSYHPGDKIRLNADLYKDINYEPEFRVGLEYEIVKNVFIRTGLNTIPFKAFFGGGLKFGRFKIDYSIASTEFLGVSHQASVGVRYQK